MDEYLSDNWSDLVAQQALNELTNKLDKLALDPLLGRREFKHAPRLYSYLLHTNTRVYYRFTDVELRVLLVWGTRQSNTSLRKALREALKS